MNNDLRDPLEDLVGAVPSYVVPDARAAWAAGARRRWRRRVGVVTAAVVVLTLVSAGVGVLPRAAVPGPADEPGGVGSYPTRIDRPLWTRSWSDVHGLGAGLLRAGDTWHVVTPDGALRRMDHAGTQVSPAISPDGRYVAWLNTGYGMADIEVTDLATGETRSSDVGLAGTHSAWTVGEGAELTWSPDSTRVLVLALGGQEPMARPVPKAVIIRADGGRSPLVVPVGRHVVPAGWLDDEQLAWASWKDSSSGVPVVDLEVLVTDLRGRVERTLPLVVDGDPGHVTATSFSVSPDGGTLAVGADLARQGIPVRFYSLTGPTAGQVRATMPGVVDAAADCPPSWGDELQVPAAGSYRDAALVDVNGGVTILADPRLGVTCSTWAPSALAGSPHGGPGGLLFGTRTTWLSWHWRETALGGVGAGTVLVVLVVLWRRRRRVSG